MPKEDRLCNLRSGVVHRYPAFESCNIDAIPLQFRLTFKANESLEGRAYRYCRRCFKS